MGSIRGRAWLDWMRNFGFAKGAPYDRADFWNQAYHRGAANMQHEWAGVTYETVRHYEYKDGTHADASKPNPKRSGSFEDLVPKTASILNVGCGTSPFADEMWMDGYQSGITNVDFSEVAINHRVHSETRLDVHWKVGDARDLKQFDSGEFDVVLDKGCIDAIYLGGTEAKFESDIGAVVAGAGRVLKRCLPRVVGQHGPWTRA